MELLLKTKFDLMDRFPNEFIYSIATLLMDVFDNQLDLESEYDRKFIRYLINHVGSIEALMNVLSNPNERQQIPDYFMIQIEKYIESKHYAFLKQQNTLEHEAFVQHLEYLKHQTNLQYDTYFGHWLTLKSRVYLKRQVYQKLHNDLKLQVVLQHDEYLSYHKRLLDQTYEQHCAYLRLFPDSLLLQQDYLRHHKQACDWTESLERAYSQYRKYSRDLLNSLDLLSKKKEFTEIVSQEINSYNDFF